MAYSDLDLNLIQHPISKELVLKKDISAVKNSMRNLLMLEFGEKPFQSHIYGGLRRFLFEQLSPELIALLKRNILSVLRTFEPRANIHDVVIYSYTNTNSLEIQVIFSVINFPTREILSLSLERIR